MWGIAMTSVTGTRAKAGVGRLASLVLLSQSCDAVRGELAGRAIIVDGDTLEIHGLRIRLWGIDAPEGSQLCRGDDSTPYRCGTKAANDLDAFIAERPIVCTQLSQDQYERAVALFRCWNRSRRMACAQRARIGLAAIFKRPVRGRPARGRSGGARDVGG